MRAVLICLIAVAIFILPCSLAAKTVQKEGSLAKVDLLGSLTGGEGSRNLVNIAIILTVLAFAPAILLLMTSFTRVVIVLSFLRQAIGIPQLPPNQVIVGLSLFLTFFIMAPTFERINSEALSPYMGKQISYDEFVGKASKEISAFMLRFAREKDIALFVNMAGVERPKNEK